MDPAALSIGARFIQFLGAVVLFGAPLLMLGPLRGVAGARAVRFGWHGAAVPFAAFMVIVGALALLSAQTTIMTGDPIQGYQVQALWAVLSGTQFGWGLGARLALAAFAMVVGGLALNRWRLRVLSLLGGGVLASFAWTGHGARDEGPAGAVHLAVDVIHLLAAGAWIGALVVFTACLAAPRLQGDAEAAEGLRLGLERFSGAGSLYVALLIATGLINGVFLVGLRNIGQTFDTPYGRALLIKLALFAGMILLATLNRFVLTPRLKEADKDQDGLGALRLSIGLETASAFAVLGLVAWLGTLAPINMG